MTNSERKKMNVQQMQHILFPLYHFVFWRLWNLFNGFLFTIVTHGHFRVSVTCAQLMVTQGHLCVLLNRIMHILGLFIAIS